MKIKTRQKKKVFIASSKEVLTNGLLNIIIKILEKNEFDPHPWNMEFPSGEIILDRLLNLNRQMDFAICFFGEDIQFTWREKDMLGTAWNVIFEFGMFLQSLGRERVRIIQYGDSYIPSDLNGLIVSKIDPKIKNLDSQIEENIQEILEQWKKIPSLHHDLFGISNSIVQYKNDLGIMLNTIDKHYKTDGLREYLKFDEKLIIDLYVNGLANVEQKFWTTTYLSSGFWAHKTGKIIEANVRMLQSLNKNRVVNVKRLFLIKHEFSEDIDILCKKIIDYKSRKGGRKKIDELKINLDTLRKNCKTFEDNRCEIKYAYDSIGEYMDIRNYIIHGDTEIAIYDDFRIDFFDGGKNSKITGLTTFTSLHKEFGLVKSITEKYFMELWRNAKPINELLEQFDEKINIIEKKVDYTLIKLLDFDHDSNKAEAELKLSELSNVKEYLAKGDYFNSITSYLDIGTCTGRYPFQLCQFFSDDCKIYGYDSDMECIKYVTVKQKFLESGKNIKNIYFSQNNLLENGGRLTEEIRVYDLITCTLGTLSHFDPTPDKTDNFDDSLQKALTKMKDMLSGDGILIVSNWTRRSVESGLLSIYNENDISVLKSGTESRSRLKKRLESLSFECEIKSVGKDQLDIFYCKIKKIKL